MIRSLSALWSVNPGFNPDGAMTFGLSLPPGMSNVNAQTVRAGFRQVDEQLKSIPGVTAATISWGALPLSGDDEQLFWMEGQPKPSNPNDMNWALKYVVEPDYLPAMGIRLKQGRFFSLQDNEHSPKVAVIDEALAARFFPNQDPVGKRISLDDGSASQQGSPVQIVGVVGHVKQWGMDNDDASQLQAQLYLSFMQLPDNAMVLSPGGVSIVVRSEGDGSGLFDSIRRTIQRGNDQQSVYGAQTMEELISSSIADRRFSMELLGAFAALALALAGVGIYGVSSHLVGQRTHEIGVRVALGAQRNDVLRLVLGQGVRLTIIGMAIGLAAALGLTQFMAKYSLLFAVSATDPLAYAAAAILLMVVALGACYIPARRATRVDPVIALRNE
jgi:predicted permease